MINDSIFFKLGGIFLEDRNNLKSILEIILKYVKIRNYCIYLIVGGGKSVDSLRHKFHQDKLDNKLKNESYHWNAIEKMDENLDKIFNILEILKLENKEYTKIPVKYIEEIPEEKEIENGLYLVKSLKLMRTYDNLEHSWTVTSDSIAIYLSHLFHLNMTILIKNVPYLEFENNQFARIDTKYLQEIMDKTGYSKNIEIHLGKGTDFPIDPYSPQLIKKIDHKVLLINGMDLKKFENFLNYYIVMEEFELPQYGTLIVS